MQSCWEMNRGGRRVQHWLPGGLWLCSPSTATSTTGALASQAQPAGSRGWGGGGGLGGRGAGFGFLLVQQSGQGRELRVGEGEITSPTGNLSWAEEGNWGDREKVGVVDLGDMAAERSLWTSQSPTTETMAFGAWLISRPFVFFR